MQRIYKRIYDIKKKYNCNIVFDTRLLKKNDIFIGLKTKNNDGNLYYKAIKKASLVIVNIKAIHPKLLYIKNTNYLLITFVIL